MHVDSNTILDKIWHWLVNIGPDILIIVIMAAVMHRVVNSLIAHIVKHSIRTNRFANKRDRVMRENTLLRLANSAVKIIIWTIAGLLIFNRLFPAINLAALGASAGILGVVVGFGAQSLIKDFGTGAFILLENQYRVGDVVQIDDIAGVVEDITLRITILRDYGDIHIIPNGTISVVTNMSRDYSNLKIDLEVGYDTDVDEAEKIINKIGVDMMQDKVWQKHIIEAPALLRVDGFSPTTMTLRIVGKTAPIQQWAVSGEYRRRLKKAFDKQQIELPLSRISITQRQN